MTKKIEKIDLKKAQPFIGAEALFFELYAQGRLKIEYNYIFMMRVIK